MNSWTNFVTVGGKGFVWLLAWSWQSLLLLGGTWLGLKIWRAKSPALRHHLWLAALVAVTLLPMLSAAIERLPLPQSNSRALAYVPAIPQPAITIELPATVNNAAVAEVPGTPNKLSVFLAAIFWIWAIGVLILLIRFWRRQLVLRRLRSAALPVSPTELGCADVKGIKLGLSPQINSPVLLGAWRPVILLPADIADWATADERRAMIRHELAHIARRDHQTNLFQNLLGAIFYFHPMVRFACRQLQIEREIACDDEVIHSGVEASLY
ncbi:MAG: M56 family metallopeptidase, partial [Blastocatellia bacterium]